MILQAHLTCEPLSMNDAIVKSKHRFWLWSEFDDFGESGEVEDASLIQKSLCYGPYPNPTDLGLKTPKQLRGSMETRESGCSIRKKRGQPAARLTDLMISFSTMYFGKPTHILTFGTEMRY